MTFFQRNRSKLSTAFLLTSLVGALGFTAYQAQAQGSCCHPGSPCCHPGSPCCAGHAHDHDRNDKT